MVGIFLATFRKLLSVSVLLSATVFVAGCVNFAPEDTKKIQSYNPLSFSKSELFSSNSQVRSGSSLTFILYLRNADGTSYYAPLENLQFEHNGGTSTGSFSTPVYQGDGTYSVVFTGIQGGTPTTIRARVGNTYFISSLSIEVVNYYVPVLAWSPLTYSFGNFDVGTTAPSQKTFTLTNTGPIAASGCSDPVISNTTDFTITSDTCESYDLLGTIGTCSVTVEAHPMSYGIKAATLSRSCVVGGVTKTTNNQITVGGMLPVLSWSPDQKSYGTIHTGVDTVPLTFTFYNNGLTAATGCSAPTTSNATDFIIVTDTCGTNNLAKNTSCAITMKANPSTTGARTTTLSRTCAFGGTTTSVLDEIKVIGVQSILTWNPLVYDFGGVGVGSSSANQVFTLSNTGTGAASSCSSPVLSNSVDFTLVSSNCNETTFNIGRTCTAQVRANPASVGLQTTTLSRTCVVGGTPSTTTDMITVTGLAPILDWSPLSHNFGTMPAGDLSESMTFTLTNTGATAGTCSAPELSNDDDFMIGIDNCATNDLLAGESCTVTVLANPQNVGTASTTLSRTCAGITAETDTNQITVTAVAPAPDVSWSLSSHDFGDVRTGRTSYTKTFIFRNTGSDDATSCGPPFLNNITDFEIVNDGCDHDDVERYGSCLVEVRAKPVMTGNKTATLTRICSSGGTDSINLTANAYSAAASQVGNASGTDFSCSLMSDGTVKCWGQGDVGQLGTGSNTDSTTPTTVSGLSGVTAVATGAQHACALLSDTTVRCWGDNTYGQLGNGASGTNSNSPVTVTGLTNVVSLSLGGSFSCAKRSDNSVQCWGYNGEGQLADGTTVDSAVPVVASSLSNVSALSSGFSHNCALINDGTVRCWGVNTNGQIGDGTTVNNPTPQTVSSLTGVTAISAGKNHTCAKLSDNTLRCWGGNSYGQLGNGTTTASSIPVTVTGVADVSTLSGRFNHTCALLADNTLTCWGRNEFGQLGDGAAANRTTATALTLTNVSEVVTGENHSCARLSDNSVRCWGKNSHGQLGDGQTSQVNIPRRIADLTSVFNMSMGATHSCAIMVNSTTKCWGNNSSGQLGNGTYDNLSTPTVISGLLNTQSIALGQSHSCSVVAGGIAKCWGLGFGPTPVNIATNIMSISAGLNHTCAVGVDQKVKCWGDNSYGQLGDGTTNNSPLTPVDALGISNASKVYLGHHHSCALLNDGKVKCWGRNDNGQLGNGSFTPSTTPVEVTGLTNVAAMATGGQFTCAGLSDQTVRCWGENTLGQLGLGNTTDFNTPQTVPRLSSLMDVRLGANHASVVHSEGYVINWGANTYGQLGLGNNTSQSSPTPIYGLTVGWNIYANSSGNQMCSSINNGDTYCWGENSYSQTGYSETSIRSVSGL